MASPSAQREQRSSSLDAAVLAMGVVACSTSVLFIKASHVHPAVLACARLTIAALTLSPLFLRDLQRNRATLASAPPPGLLRVALWPGVALGTHLVVWNAGARMTSAANASLVVNMVPLLTPMLLRVLGEERLRRDEWIGTTLGIAGIVALSAGDLQLDRTHLWGDAVCFLAMALFAIYLVLGQRSRQVPTLFLYVVPVYSVAALTCALACLALDAPVAALWQRRELSMALGLALVPTVLGHSALNHAMARLRGQAVSVGNLAQPLSAALLAFLFLGEVPSAAFYAASGLILLGAATALGLLRPTLASKG